MKALLKIFNCFLFIQLISFLSQGQELYISGTVRDSENSVELPFSNIMILHQNAGTTADIAGRFSLNLTNDNLNDTLVVSCIGYYTKLIPISEMEQIILLNPRTYVLETFQYISRAGQTARLNQFRKRDCFVPHNNKLTCDTLLWFPHRPDEPTIEALYFPLSMVGSPNAKIYEAWIYVHSFKLPAYFRLRLIQADNNEQPFYDLISESIIVEVNKKDELIKINLEKYNLFFPKDGLFVGFELLIQPENKSIVALPDQSGSVELLSPFLQYYPLSTHDFDYWLYTGGVWEKRTINDITLSNYGVLKPAITLVIER